MRTCNNKQYLFLFFAFIVNSFIVDTRFLNIGDVIRQSIKGMKTPHPLTKDRVLWHTGSNVIGFILRNSNQKGGKITCLIIL